MKSSLKAMRDIFPDIPEKEAKDGFVKMSDGDLLIKLRSEYSVPCAKS